MLLHSPCVPPLAPASLATAPTSLATAPSSRATDPFVCTLLCALHRFECSFEASLGGSSVPTVAPTGPRTHDRRGPKRDALTAELSPVWLSSAVRGRTPPYLLPPRARTVLSVSASRHRGQRCVCVCVCVCVCACATTGFFSYACSWPSPPLLITSQNLLPSIRKATITNAPDWHAAVLPRQPRFGSFVPRLPFTGCEHNKTGAGPAKCGCRFIAYAQEPAKPVAWVSMILYKGSGH